ncbi:MAG: alpha/beta hydrolase [Candidatus Heimdallarchaeaceae archaeon]
MNKKGFNYILGTVTLLLNLICIIHGIVYLATPSNSHYWNFAGILLMLTILLNGVILIHFGKLGSPSIKKRKFRIASYGYFLFSIIAYFMMFLANFIGFNIGLGLNLAIGLLLGLSYFGILLYPLILIAYFIYNKKEEVLQEEKLIKPARRRLELILKITLIVGNIVGLLLGILTALTILTTLRFGLFSFFFSVFAAMSGIFFGLGAISNTFTLLHFVKKNARFFRTKIIVIASFGLVISSICFVPLFSTPSSVVQADEEFSSAFNPYFGGDWKEAISQSGYEDYFLKQPFQMMGYFLGNGNPECETLLDVVYFNGSESVYAVDNNVLLYFDAYLPLNNGEDLPGNNSVIIRIHGGGWTIGDKGLGNVRMMNRYLAAQGYCVFDIQYGLTNMTSNLGSIYPPPSNVVSNFTIDDMVRHIGNFTTFLELHSTEYRTNLDSVFVSGGSSGGQLTCAVALSIASGNYTEVNPYLLINSSSPPCLIFQGEKDHSIIRSQLLKDTYYNLGRTDCALLTFPFGGHASDIYFPGYYNQVFLYYMERFLYLYH